MAFVPAPDFPTGGTIIGRSGTHAAYRSGRGAVVLRAKSHVEEVRSGREALVFTEMPYQVNKAKLQERIANASARSWSRALPNCATRATATGCASSSN